MRNASASAKKNINFLLPTSMLIGVLFVTPWLKKTKKTIHLRIFDTHKSDCWMYYSYIIPLKKGKEFGWVGWIGSKI